MGLGRLNNLSVARLGAGNHNDGGGLYLRVVGGSRTWSFRYQLAGKQHWLGLGRVSDWSLAEARQKARDCRRKLSEGQDLAATLRAARKPPEAGRTVDDVATLYIEAHREGWKNAKHAAQWRATLDQHAAILLTLPVGQVTTDHVLDVLRPIWSTKTETASRLRGRIEAVVDYATARHWRTGDNPARWRGHLDALLPARGKVAAVEHHAALAWRAMPPVMARLQASKGAAAQCAAFIALTAARSSEARDATWGEINLDAKVWTIPAERMKAGKEHRVPLSDAALQILTEAAKQRGAGDYIFPGGRAARPLSDVAVSKALHLAADTAETTVHGLRSCFRDWCAESAVAREVAEASLAHTNRDKVESAYARSDLLERRRDVMQAWGGYCVPDAPKQRD